MVNLHGAVKQVSIYEDSPVVCRTPAYGVHSVYIRVTLITPQGARVFVRTKVGEVRHYVASRPSTFLEQPVVLQRPHPWIVESRIESQHPWPTPAIWTGDLLTVTGACHEKVSCRGFTYYAVSRAYIVEWVRPEWARSA